MSDPTNSLPELEELFDESTAIPLDPSELVVEAAHQLAEDKQLALLMQPVDNGNGKAVPTFKWWYESIIDWMLLNPGSSLADCAKALGRTPVTVRMIARSDAFRARFAQRRAEYNNQLANQLTDQATKLALASLNVLTDRVTNNPAKIPTAELTDLTSKVLDKLGYGVKPTGATANVQVNVGVSQDVLREAQRAMRTVQTINAEEVSNG